MLTAFIGAEGCAELEGTDWIRPATPDETISTLTDFAQKMECFIEDARARLNEDRTGRPYWPMTLEEHAPNWAKEAFRKQFRMVQLERKQ